jgi:hypothetical protein
VPLLKSHSGYKNVGIYGAVHRRISVKISTALLSLFHAWLTL